MDPSNPIDVKALLEQLRVSKSWQEATSASQNNQGQGQIQQPPQDDASEEASSSATSTRVAELLALLKAPPPATPVFDHPPPTPQPLHPPQQAHSDLRICSYPSALSLISGLGDDPSFLASIKELREEQDNLERQLWADRERIHKKYEDKVKTAQTRATLTGGHISKHEATMLQDAFKRELRKYDQERVQLAWDGLVTRQQARLEQLKVPNMFVTSDPKDRVRQSQIIQVLVGLTGANT